MSNFEGTSKFNCLTSTSVRSPLTKPILLRPSQLAVGNESPQGSTTWNIFPPKSPALANPFSRVPPDSSNKEKEKSSKTCTDNSENNSDSKKGQCDTNKENCENESKDHLGKEKTNEKGSATPQASAPKFVRLGTPSHKQDSLSGSASTSKTTASPAVATSSSSTAATGVTGFVFGQNMHERVVEPIVGESVNSLRNPAEIAGTSSRKDQNSDSSNALTNNLTESADKPSKSLNKAAREYEEAKTLKRKYEEVTVVTGEEGETNVLQMNCKLFAFDKAGSTWVEHGRGTLRLNDKVGGPGGGVLQSRVLVRTTGSLRVILNTRIWAGMSVGRPSPKSVRLTAMDNMGQIKVFLIMASPKETQLLFKCLECRLLSLKQAQQPNSKLESGATGGDLGSCSLPPEPSLKKRPS